MVMLMAFSLTVRESDMEFRAVKVAAKVRLYADFHQRASRPIALSIYLIQRVWIQASQADPCQRAEILHGLPQRKYHGFAAVLSSEFVGTI